MENETLLTGTEILTILENTKLQGHLRSTNFLNIFDRKPTAIFRITPINELIFIRGNNDTGWIHIVNRHSYGKIFASKDPSRFRNTTVPFGDFADIADSVYAPENMNILNNKAPDRFDLYIGKHRFFDNVEEEYKLLLYKGTKVVHNLFPTTRKNNRKKVKKH